MNAEMRRPRAADEEMRALRVSREEPNRASAGGPVPPRRRAGSRRSLQERRIGWLSYGAAVSVTILALLSGAQHAFLFERQLWWVRSSGWVALAFLLLALSASPVKRGLEAWRGRSLEHRVGPLRRALGISAAALASIHALVALKTYLDGAFGSVLSHPWLRAGVLALAVLIALWVTSYPRLVRSLRVKLWKPLHRLAFVAGLLAFQHVMLSPFAPRGWTLAVFGAAAVLGLLRLIPAPPRREPKPLAPDRRS